MRCDVPLLRCRFFLIVLVSGSLPIVSSADGKLHHRPITRREGVLRPDDEPQRAAASQSSSLIQLTEATSSTGSQGRACPSSITCGERADNLIWDQACWDCVSDYQQLYCEKSSLTSPAPTFVDICASQGKYRGAFCKKFAESEPAEYYEECFFPGSEYKQIYCEKLKLKGQFKGFCANDKDVGPSYCQGFAGNMQGYIECHKWPDYMMLHCAGKQKAKKWDATCAHHKKVGPSYCEDFALAGDIKPDCVKYASYLTLFCDVKASNNASVETCASTERVSGMYCQQLALKKNGFKACWGVAQFDTTYCAEVSWSNPACDSLSGTASIDS